MTLFTPSRRQSAGIVAPGETIEVGDLVVTDRDSGKLRKFDPARDAAGWRVPQGSRVNAATGCLEMPR